MQDLENEGIRAKLAALAGAQLTDLDVVDILAEVVRTGGGVHVEVDDTARYKLIRREGRFVLSKDGRARNSVPPRSSIPPRR